jgi:glutamate-5-semialdehyde dehydrogenase
VAILHRIADGLLAAQEQILAANAEDVAAAESAAVAPALLARLKLTPGKLASLAGALACARVHAARLA